MCHFKGVHRKILSGLPVHRHVCCSIVRLSLAWFDRRNGRWKAIRAIDLAMHRLGDLEQ